MMHKRIIHTQPPYPLFIDQNLLSSDELLHWCHHHYSRCVIVTDDRVGPLYAETLKQYCVAHQLPTSIVTLPQGEASKTRKTKAYVEDQLFELACGRDTCLLALGGGVITDLTGFVAATYLRGIPVIYLPTTLMAVVDAAIGGKTGINTAYGKNLIGTFTQPQAIFADIATLQTLSEKDYLGGFAEMIKHGLVFDPEYFEFLATHTQALKQRDVTVLKQAIQRSCEIKIDVIEGDMMEKGKRALLNFGHTIGHAIEAACDYQIHHGQAVAIGMVTECLISYRLGYLKASVVDAVIELIESYDLPLTIEWEITKEDLSRAILMDKKNRRQTPRFVLLNDIGQPLVSDTFVHEIDESILDQAMEILVSNEFISVV